MTMPQQSRRVDHVYVTGWTALVPDLERDAILRVAHRDNVPASSGLPMHTVLIHDYLTQYGGAERVLEALHAHYPESDVLTSLYRPDQLPPAFRSWAIRTSVLGRLPGVSRTHRLWLPLYPAIFGALGRSIDRADIVIADSSAWSHHARPGSGIPTICYCHSPARFLYGDRDYLRATRGHRLVRSLSRHTFGPLRWLDRRASHRVTRYVANSAAVAARIAQAYGITASVVYPPVDVERFRPANAVPVEDWFLVVSRLVPHKWINRAVRASNASGYRLKIIGEGRSLPDLERIAGPGVEFLGALADSDVAAHMQRCRALIVPGVEDFGMTAVEAQAAGRPVIAARGGGALETVVDGETGFFFDPDDDASLPKTMLAAVDRSWDTGRILANAARFRPERFVAEMEEQIAQVLATPTRDAPGSAGSGGARP